MAADVVKFQIKFNNFAKGLLSLLVNQSAKESEQPCAGCGGRCGVEDDIERSAVL